MSDVVDRYGDLNDSLLSRIKFYCPPRNDEVIDSDAIGGELSIGALVTGRLNAALRYESNVHLLTPSNWKFVLEHSKLDFILIESCFETVTRDWYMAQLTQNDANAELRELLGFARGNEIPTVYWFTKDSQYHSNYAAFAALADHVYCADPEELILLERQGISAKLLLPAVQPRIFNPYRSSHSEQDDIGVVYDGLIDIIKSAEKFDYLRRAGISLCDSNNQLFAGKLNSLSVEGWRVLGSVDIAHKPDLIKFSKGVLSSSQSVIAKTEQQWMMVEAAACRVPLYHLGEIPSDDIRGGLCYSTSSLDELGLKLERDAEDYLSWQHQAHLAWREVNAQHTYAMRLATIAQDLGLEQKNGPDFMASVLAPTYRKDFIPRVLETFRGQLYEKKELVIVYNGDMADLANQDFGLAANERIVALPGEMSAGACLNLAYQLAIGTHTFRMDDDDYYGPYYLFDSMLHLGIVDCDMYGKPPKFVYFEEDRQLYARSVQMRDLQVFPSEKLGGESLWLAGNTIGLRKSAANMPRYPDASVATADTFLALVAADYGLKVMCMDVMNIVVSRRADLSSHTWAMGHDKLKRGAELVRGGISDVLGII